MNFGGFCQPQKLGLALIQKITIDQTEITWCVLHIIFPWLATIQEIASTANNTIRCDPIFCEGKRWRRDGGGNKWNQDFLGLLLPQQRRKPDQFPFPFIWYMKYQQRLEKNLQGNFITGFDHSWHQMDVYYRSFRSILVVKMEPILERRSNRSPKTKVEKMVS